MWPTVYVAVSHLLPEDSCTHLSFTTNQGDTMFLSYGI